MAAGDLWSTAVDARCRIEEYIAWVEANKGIVGPIGDKNQGEIQIVTDIDEILRAEQQVGRPLALAIQGAFSAFVLHPVYQQQEGGSFRYGSYHQVIWGFEQKSRRGMAILCLSDDDQILLIRQFRRPTGTWEWEPPAFSNDPGEEGKIRQAIERELMEEAGAEPVGELIPLGEYTTDSGMMHLANLLFAVRAKLTRGVGTGAKEEAIAERRWFSLAEIVQAFQEGQFQGANFRDGRLNALLTQAHIRGIINLPSG